MDPKPWTEEDDARLRSLIGTGDSRISWTTLSRNTFPSGKFTKGECIERWRLINKPKGLRGPWTKDEDSKLEALVQQYGSEKWVGVASEMGSRTGKQCRERWHNHLDPTINKGEWTAEEDKTINRLFAQMGSRWAEMAKHLPGRPDNAIKNYWNASLVRKKRRRGDSISTLAGALEISSGEQAPSMSKSSSSNSLSRFAPYVRASPMSKSRSEQALAPAVLSPLRGGSAAGTDTLASSATSPFASLYYSPTPLSRSQSFSSPTTPRDTRLNGAPPPALAVAVVARDLNKEMFDTHTGMFPGAHNTPPATPDRAPVRRKHSNSSRYASPSPPTTASLYSSQTFDSTDAWREDQQQEVLNDALGFEPLGPFADLQIGEQFAPYEVPAHEQDYFDSKYGAGTPHHAEQVYLSQSQSLDSLYDDGRFDSPLASPYIHPHHHLGPDQRPFDHPGQFDEWGNPLPLTASPSELQQGTSSQSQYGYFPASYGSLTNLAELARPSLVRTSSSTSSFLPSDSSSYPHSPLSDEPPSSINSSSTRTGLRSSHRPSRSLSTTLAPAIELPTTYVPEPLYEAYTTLKPPPSSTLSSSYVSTPFLATLAEPRRIPRMVGSFSMPSGLSGSLSLPSGLGKEWSAAGRHPTSDLMDVDKHGRACLPDGLGTSAALY